MGLCAVIFATFRWPLWMSVKSSIFQTVLSVCLGQMACTTCMVKFKNDNDAKIVNSLCDTKEEEIDMMDTNENYDPNNCRLACQLKFTKDDISKFRGDIELVGIE